MYTFLLSFYRARAHTRVLFLIHSVIVIFLDLRDVYHEKLCTTVTSKYNNRFEHIEIHRHYNSLWSEDETVFFSSLSLFISFWLSISLAAMDIRKEWKHKSERTKRQVI